MGKKRIKISTSSIFTFFTVATIVISGYFAIKLYQSKQVYVEDKAIKDIAYRVKAINNIRYDGYDKTSTENLLHQVCTEELANDLAVEFSNKAYDRFISFEDDFKYIESQDNSEEFEQYVREHPDSVQAQMGNFNIYAGAKNEPSDEYFTEVNGQRGMWLHDLVKITSPINPTVNIHGQDVEIDKKYLDSTVDLKGVDTYDFNIIDWYAIEDKDGQKMLRVKLQAKGGTTPFVVEYSCILDKDNKITSISDSKLLYSKLAVVS